ncbi:unnamed protein product [Oppiella nova]|uniref:Uncharacterized protein n=1 Tax=Oppiella nova TaxID=334625 RepID=A0A7R9M983_9ACAR|nr:unnamed protein product [Oppiella nova]CAG2173132.1 unnamed protein product [Oppiella nova]
MNELLITMNYIREPMGCTVTWELSDVTQYKSVMVMRFAQSIQDFIKMVKKLDSFKTLCGDDRLSLIKYGCVENLCMRSLQYYDLTHEYWTLYAGNDSSILLKTEFFATCEPSLLNPYKNYFSKIGPEWDSDHNIIDLLSYCLIQIGRPLSIGMSLNWSSDFTCTYFTDTYT